MDYRRFEVEGPEFHLYPLVCWHLGAKQSDMKFIERVIRVIKDDPLARWIYMGDAGECNIKESKGDIFAQTMSPGEQLNLAVELLAPVRDKALFGISGNHGLRIYKATGVDWDQNLCERVGIPYCGTSCLFDVGVRIPSSKHSEKYVSCYVHHGVTSSITSGGKVMAGKKPEQFIVADVIMTAHSHSCGEIPCPLHYAHTDPKHRKIVWETSYAFLCGSAYDSRSGYAEMKMYPPIRPEHIVIKAKLKRIEKRLGDRNNRKRVEDRLVKEITSDKLVSF